MRRKFTLLLLSILCAFLTPAFSQNFAISLDGSTSTVSTAAYIVPTSGDFTVEFWAYVPTLNTGLHEFMSQGNSGGGFYIGYDQGTGNFRAGDNWQNTGVPIPVGRWMHIALVDAGGAASFYLDGALQSTNPTYSLSAGTSFFTIGNQFSGFSEFMNGSMDEIRIWNIARTAAQIKQGLYGTVAPATAGLVAYYNANEGAGTVLDNSTANTGLNGTLNNTTWVNSPIQFGSNALTFDGFEDQVIAPPSAAYDLSSGTIEAWVYPTLLDGTNRCIVANRATLGARWSFNVSSTQIGLWNGTTFGTINESLPLNTWTQLAFVCDGTQTTVYVNGASIGAIPEAFGTVTGQTLNIGITKSAGADAEPWEGAIDEVRIWNIQRSASDIAGYMNFTATGTETGLVGLFSFDQGNPGNDNSNLITAIDNTPASNNATLFNFALTGTTSNFTSHPLVFDLPVTFTTFTAVPSNGDALLHWQTAQEQNSADFIIQRSVDGTNYSAIGSVAAAGNSSTPRNYDFTDGSPAQGLNYYRLKETDLDGNALYSVIRTVTFSDASGPKLIWYAIGNRSATVVLSTGTNELYSLTDLSGKTLQLGRLNEGKLTISQLPAGIYIVKVTMAGGQSLDTKVLLP
jgi:hypothetical protein